MTKIGEKRVIKKKGDIEERAREKSWKSCSWVSPGRHSRHGQGRHISSEAFNMAGSTSGHARKATGGTSERKELQFNGLSYMHDVKQLISLITGTDNPTCEVQVENVGRQTKRGKPWVGGRTEPAREKSGVRVGGRNVGYEVNVSCVSVTGARASCVNLTDVHDATRHDADATPRLQIALAGSIDTTMHDPLDTK